jgi:hypothetical protein
MNTKTIYFYNQNLIHLFYLKPFTQLINIITFNSIVDQYIPSLVHVHI